VRLLPDPVRVRLRRGAEGTATSWSGAWSDATEPKRQRGGICVQNQVSTPKTTSFVQMTPAPKTTSIADTEGRHCQIVDICVYLTAPEVISLYRDLVEYLLDCSRPKYTKSLPSSSEMWFKSSCSCVHSALSSALSCLPNWIDHRPELYAWATSVSGCKDIWNSLWKLIFRGHSPTQKSCQNLVC
jgi:hypothetical protein